MLALKSGWWENGVQPPECAGVCVELEIHSFANCQVLAPTISYLFDELINNILSFCFPCMLALHNIVLGNGALCAPATQ